MLKKILTPSVLIIMASITFTGCNQLTGEYHKVIEFDAEKNIIVVDYKSDKITYGYFIDKVNDYCTSKGRITSVNGIKTIDKTTERVSFSCIVE
jgi:hypothetical protein